MNEIARHIEILLLENDCVIVPDFGGFVAYYTPAGWNGNEQMFYPPARVIGFNPKLVINDGILAQSYMKSYDTTFSGAVDIIESQVDELTDSLARYGKVGLPNIGEIYYTLAGEYGFVAYNNKMVSPNFYGLDAFAVKDLHSIRKEMAGSVRPGNSNTRSPGGKQWRKTGFTIARNASVGAAAVMLFFLLSPPLGNTYVERHEAASMLPSELWKQIERHSLLINPVAHENTAAGEDPDAPAYKDNSAETDGTQTGNEAETASPDTTAPAETPAAPAEQHRLHHIIVASVNREKDAEAIKQQLLNEGYTDAQIVNRDDKMRISIMAYPTFKEAMDQLLALRKTEAHKNAWLLSPDNSR